MNVETNYSKEQWTKTIIYFQSKCAYCGKIKELTQDHFIPLSKGGEYTLNNIIPACGTCNSSKFNNEFLDWYSKQSFYTKKREKKILDYLNYNNGIQQLSLII